jgi:uroporphyrinogen decarboxylase
LDIGGTTVTGIAITALGRFLKERGLESGLVLTDTVQQTALPNRDILKSMGVDTVRIGPDRIKEPHPSAVTDDFGVRWEKKVGELYYSQTSWPLRQGDLLSDALSSYAFPEPDRDYLASLVRGSRSSADGSCPVLDRDCAGLMEMSARLRGTESFYTDFYTDPAAVEALAELLYTYKTAYWETMLKAWGEGPVVVSEADDYGTDISLLVSPEILRKMYFPRYRKLFAFIKKLNPEAKIFFHSCGAVKPIIPDFIEMGVDILNPVQYSAKDMELPSLKRDFGRDITFWGGGIDTKEILPLGKPEKVRDEIKRVLDILAPGGGFVFATIHNIQADVPPANLEAMLETLSTYGRYR